MFVAKWTIDLQLGGKKAQEACLHVFKVSNVPAFLFLV